MHDARGDFAAITREIRFGLAVHGEDHLALQNDVGSHTGVRVIGVELFRIIAPHVCMSKTFVVEL